MSKRRAAKESPVANFDGPPGEWSWQRSVLSFPVPGPQMDAPHQSTSTQPSVVLPEIPEASLADAQDLIRRLDELAANAPSVCAYLSVAEALTTTDEDRCTWSIGAWIDGESGSDHTAARLDEPTARKIEDAIRDAGRLIIASSHAIEHAADPAMECLMLVLSAREFLHARVLEEPTFHPSRLHTHARAILSIIYVIGRLVRAMVTESDSKTWRSLTWVQEATRLPDRTVGISVSNLSHRLKNLPPHITYKRGKSRFVEIGWLIKIESENAHGYAPMLRKKLEEERRLRDT